MDLQGLKSLHFGNTWKQTCSESLANMMKNETYLWARPHPGANVVPGEWVL